MNAHRLSLQSDLDHEIFLLCDDCDYQAAVTPQDGEDDVAAVVRLTAEHRA
jgi:hypothetical protein